MRIYLDNLKFCQKLNLIEYFIKKKHIKIILYLLLKNYYIIVN